MVENGKAKSPPLGDGLSDGLSDLSKETDQSEIGCSGGRLMMIPKFTMWWK